MLYWLHVTVLQKVNQIIDYKTRLVGELDKKNIALNKVYGLYGQKPCDTPAQTTVRSSVSTLMYSYFA